MTRKLKVMIAAGGTAGHINPALALAEELAARGHEVRFVGQPTKLEAELVPAAGFGFVPIEVTGFNRRRPWTLVSALVRMEHAERQLGELFEREGTPDVACGFGAYVEMPLVRWCESHGVPVVLHEQNSVPGLANKSCARRATTLCLSFPEARGAFEGHVGPATRVVVTGCPVRRSVREASREEGRSMLGVRPDETLLLVFGGSLGARHVNDAVAALKGELLGREGLRVVHSTGKALFDEVRSSLALSPEEEGRWQVVPYIDDMGHALAAADLVVSRAGASSIAEIAALGVPSVLVPYPLATENHQATNARYLVDAGAAALVDDDELDAPVFRETLLGLVDSPGRRREMREAARSLGSARAAALVAESVESAARG